MKKPILKNLSVLLSLCMLGTSPVSAADFSDGTKFAEDTTPSQTDSTSDATVSGDFQTDDSADNAASFNSDDEMEIFTDDSSDDNSEFSSDEPEASTEEPVVAGALDSSISTYYANSAVEADIPIDSSINTICTTYKGSNLEAQNYASGSSPVYSYLTTSPDGSLMRVQGNALDGKLLMEYYDTSYNLKRTMTLDLPLPIFGAFYETSNNYYILTGASNPNENNSQEVYHVTKYSKDWKALGSCGLFGANTTAPFAAGSARMTVNGNYLYIRTCHRMYKSTDGYNHQANVTFSVNTSDMSIVDQYTGIMNTSMGYVSHSFNQFIRVDNGTLLGLDHGDAYPRSIVLLKYNTDISNGLFVPSYNKACTPIHILSFPGNIGANYTGASVGGFEYSDSSYLIAGNYDTNGSSSPRNVFIASVSKDGGTPVIRYLSNYAGTEDSASTPHLIKTGNNSFIIMWSSRGYVYYTTLDGTGQQTGTTYKMAGNLSDCVPAITNGKLIWYTWKNDTNTFYSINLSNPSENHATRFVNGHKFANETPVNGLMTRTCTVCGYQEKISVPVSIDLWGQQEPDSTYYSYMSRSNYMDIGQNKNIWWTTNFNSDNSSYPKLSECEISSSDTSVLSLKMTSSDMATITAKKAGKATLTIKSKYSDDYVLQTDFYVNMITSRHSSLSLSSSSYTYDGTEHKPTVTLKINKNTVKEGTDFKVSYDGDLVNAGTVTVTATGIGKYIGSTSTTFQIRPVALTKDDFNISVAPAYYNGAEQKPALTLTYKGKVLSPDTDYTVSYSNNISVTDYADAYVRLRGNYSGSFYTYFQIQKGDLSKCKISLSADTLPYDGSEKKPTVTVKAGDRVLTANTDYTVTYSNNKNVGTASVTVKGRGNYTGSLSKNFLIAAADLSNLTAVLSADTFRYDGTAKKPSATVKYGSKTLIANTDFTLSYENNTNVGTATAIITGKGNYKGSIKKQFKITPADFSKLSATLSTDTFRYDGSEKKPGITVKAGSKQLSSGTDFSVSYSNNKNVGTATATITGNGNYSGTITKSFKITPADFTKLSATLSADSFSYDGTEKKPGVTVTSGNKKLTADTDFTVSYTNNINTGTATVTITGNGNYSGAITKKFTITPADISVLSASLSADRITYNGTAQKPDVTVTSGNKQLTLNTDYTVSYTNNTNVGIATATITGNGNYSGNITKQFTIIPADISSLTVSLSDDSLFYDGTEQKPAVTVKSGKKTLVLNTDFTVSYSDNINIGTATVTITGKGNYSGSVTRTFTIAASDIRKCEVRVSPSSYVYDGTPKTPEVTVTFNGKTLAADTDYTISYSNNINAGSAQVKITGKGTYAGSISKTFKITRIPAVITAKNLTLNQSTKKYSAASVITDGSVTLKTSNSKIVKVSGTRIIPVAPGKVTLTITAARGNNYEKTAKTITVTVRPLNTSKLSVKSTAKGQAAISWTAAKSISGYEIYYSQRSNMKNAKYVTAKNTAKSTKLTKLSSKKKYYVRIRTYKIVSGKKYYSAWSTIKSVTIK